MFNALLVVAIKQNLDPDLFSSEITIWFLLAPQYFNSELYCFDL